MTEMILGGIKGGTNEWTFAALSDLVRARYSKWASEEGKM